MCPTRPTRSKRRGDHPLGRSLIGTAGGRLTSCRRPPRAESRKAPTYAALKHTYEKVGDHWEAKDEPGPSDDRAEKGGLNDEESAGGVDANATKQHLLGIARRLDVRGRSSMTKAELVDAIGKANEKANAKARQN